MLFSGHRRMNQNINCEGSRRRTGSGIIINSTAQTRPHLAQCSDKIFGVTAKTLEDLDSQRGFWHRRGTVGGSIVDGVDIGSLDPVVTW